MKNTRTRMQRWACGVAAAAMLVGLSGCAGTSDDAEAGATDEGPTPTSASNGTSAPSDVGLVRIGVANSASDAQFCIGSEKGYFADEGIEVELVPFASGGDMIAPLAAGDLQVGSGAASPALYNALGRDIDLRVVADKGSIGSTFSYLQFVARQGLADEIESVDDLTADLHYANHGQGSTGQVPLSMFFENNGFGIPDVQQDFMGGGDMLTALSTEGIDVALVAEPIPTLAEQQGVGYRLAGTNEVYPDQQLSVLFYSPTFAEEDTTTADAFMRAYIRSARDFAGALDDSGRLTGEGADEIIEMVSGCFDIEADLLGSMVMHDLDPDGDLDVESMQKDYQFFDDLGMIEPDAASVEDAVDTSFLERAHDELSSEDS